MISWYGFLFSFVAFRLGEEFCDLIFIKHMANYSFYFYCVICDILNLLFIVSRRSWLFCISLEK